MHWQTCWRICRHALKANNLPARMRFFSKRRRSWPKDVRPGAGRLPAFSKNFEVFEPTRQIQTRCVGMLSEHAIDYFVPAATLMPADTPLWPSYTPVFKRRGIGAAQLAHTAAQLLYRFVFVRFHPGDHALFHFAEMVGSFAEQNAAEHGNVGADHQHLQHVFGRVYAADRSHAGAYFAEFQSRLVVGAMPVECSAAHWALFQAPRGRCQVGRSD